MTPWSWPRWIAHRAGGCETPENTLAGVQRAAKRGFGAIEVDVRLAADGQPVIIHDDTVLRTCGVTGSVAALSSAQLAQLRANVGFEGSAFRDATIPTLEQLLLCAAQAGVCVNLELKLTAESPAALVESVAQVLDRVGEAAPPERILLSCFDAPALQASEQRLPALSRALLALELTPQIVETAQELGCVSLNLAAEACTAATLASARRAGLQVCAWTVNDLAQARRLLALGVAALFTDRLEFAALD
jgi:glycerophosphoryl diester phosphodiesterase